MDGIWIRSQDRTQLMCCRAVTLNPDHGIDGLLDVKLGLLIGKYGKERAQQVMDDIQKHIFNGVHEVYQMPKE